jgi:hypothetical protein
VEPNSPEDKVSTHAKNDSGRPAVVRVAGRRRGPNILGNLAMPGPPRRVSGLFEKITLWSKSLWIIL